MEEILHQLSLVVYPIIHKVLYIPGGAGFLPSTVLINNTTSWKSVSKNSKYVEPISTLVNPGFTNTQNMYARNWERTTIKETELFSNPGFMLHILTIFNY